MGGCNGTRQTESDMLLENCQIVIDRIGLNCIYWKDFVSKVALYGVVSNITAQKVRALMDDVQMLNSFSNEASPLRQFLSSLHLDSRCNAKELILIGLLMCKGSDKEKGEFFCSLIEDGAEWLDAREVIRVVSYAMIAAVQVIPELALKSSGRESKLAARVIAMHNELLRAAMKRWLPWGRVKGDRIVMTKSELVDWVARGELDPIKALTVALAVYQSMKDISIITLDENYNEFTQEITCEL
eukprot:TRINITY_DN3069_c0_g4_i2.p1 TRINITY_DN3069_c0_g4~~TRINITY_DN3069_c0_g4_i2.p1  ORF type:complete len:242 (+),score=56.63 TRINITY_DN3069_c0_g4_i2:151-876(+)